MQWGEGARRLRVSEAMHVANAELARADDVVPPNIGLDSKPRQHPNPTLDPTCYLRDCAREHHRLRRCVEQGGGNPGPLYHTDHGHLPLARLSECPTGIRNRYYTVSRGTPRSIRAGGGKSTRGKAASPDLHRGGCMVLRSQARVNHSVCHGERRLLWCL